MRSEIVGTNPLTIKSMRAHNLLFYIPSESELDCSYVHSYDYRSQTWKECVDNMCCKKNARIFIPAGYTPQLRNKNSFGFLKAILDTVVSNGKTEIARGPPRRRLITLHEPFLCLMKKIISIKKKKKKDEEEETL